jgi:predicted small integral membrane protein
MDASRLTRGELIAGLAGLALLIASVVPFWGSVSLDVSLEGFQGITPIEGIDLGTGDSFSLWDAGVFGLLPKLAVLIGVVVVVLAILRALGAAPTFPTVTYLALGVTATLLLLMGVAVGPSLEGGGLIVLEVEVTRGPLLYLGLILGAAMLVGGWLHLRSEDTDDFGNRNAAPPPM